MYQHAMLNLSQSIIFQAFWFGVDLHVYHVLVYSQIFSLNMKFYIFSQDIY